MRKYNSIVEIKKQNNPTINDYQVLDHTCVYRHVWHTLFMAPSAIEVHKPSLYVYGSSRLSFPSLFCLRVGDTDISCGTASSGSKS